MNLPLSFNGASNTPPPLPGQAENREKDNSATNGTNDTRPGSGKAAPTVCPRGAATVPGGPASAVPATGPEGAFSGISDGSPMPRAQVGGEAGNFQRKSRMCDRPGYAEFYRDYLLPAQGGTLLGISTHIRTDPQNTAPKTIHIYPGKGVVSQSNEGNKIKVPGSGGNRGNIDGFTLASRKRFREAIISRAPATESWEIGVTFTVPGTPPTVEEAKSMFHRLQLAISRAGMGMFWRIELQTARQAAHWHCLIIASKNEYSQGDLVPFFQKLWADLLKSYTCKYVIREKWGKKTKRGVNWALYEDEIMYDDLSTEIEVVNETERDSYFVHTRELAEIPRSMVKGAFLPDYSQVKDKSCACLVETINDNGIGWTRYLCDHATKVKREQVARGYGRQWGVVGRDKFKTREASSILNMSDKAFAVWLRAVGKMTRPRIRAKCVFGKKAGWRKRRGKTGRAVWFGNDSTYIRLAEWAAGQG